MLTVGELAKTITENCPPNCNDRIRVKDSLTGDVGEIKKVRYVHTPRGMALEIIVDGDMPKDGRL